MSSELAEGASLAYAVSSGKEVPILDKVKWKKSFGKLGEIMMKAFCGDNLLFKEHLSRGIENAGGVKNTRVRFVVDSNYQIAFEALFLPPPSEPHHWLLEAPLLRHLRMPGACEMDLFGVGTAPKRVLVVCADTCGVAQLEGPSPRTLNLDKIRWMRKECEFVAHMLQKLLPSFAKPTIIGANGKPVTAEQLLSVLKKGWDIVHFAGHSYYESDDPNRSGRGYLFVGPEHNPTPLNMETVAPYLKNCRLLYLSSCQSASSSFAVAAGNAGVPVIVGYRWPVGDRHAMMHARLFYRNLDRCRSVEHAFWSTQRTIAKHDSASGNIWASSMLVTAYH
jgi:hypothetical protein